MSQSDKPVHAVNQDEDTAANARLRDRNQRDYGPQCPMCGFHARLAKPDNFVLVLTRPDGKDDFVGPFRTEKAARSWHYELWPDDDLPWSVEPMPAPR